MLESILSKDACKSSLPTLDQLTTHPFFGEYAGHFNDLYATTIAVQKPHLKFSTSAKEQLKLAVQKTENRVRDEQRSVKNQKRLVRVQEMMTSEEEKKKIKQKAVSKYFPPDSAVLEQVSLFRLLLLFSQTCLMSCQLLNHICVCVCVRSFSLFPFPRSFPSVCPFTIET